MTLFTQDESKKLVESVAGIMAQRVAGATLPEMVREAAVEAGKASVGKSLEERSKIMHRYFNISSAEAQIADRAFMPTNRTVNDFNEVAVATRNQCEAAEAAGSFEDVAKADGSPLSAEDRARLNKRKTNEDAESAGSFEDVADDEGSPLSAEDRARLNKRKVKEELRARSVAYLENLSNFGDKKKKFPPDKDGDGKVNEEDTTGTDSELEDVDADERQVSVKVKTVRDIDTVPVSKTHSFVNESWTVLVNTDELSIGEQHLLAGNLVEQDEVIEASAGCPTNRQPFTVTVKGGSEIEAIENLVSALENAGSSLGAEEVLVAHRTPSKGGPARLSEGRAVRGKPQPDDELFRPGIKFQVAGSRLLDKVEDWLRTGGFKYKSKFVKSGDFGSAGEDIEQIEITSWVDAGAASSLTRMEKQVGPSGRSTLQLTGETTAEREGVNTSSIKVASPKTEFKR